MDKKARLETLINYFADGNQRRFAEMLGVSPQVVNSWLSRNSYDIELIYSSCDGVSGDWLIAGDGNMLKSENQNFVDKQGLDDSNKELIQLCHELVKNYQQRDQVMTKLVSLFND